MFELNWKPLRFAVITGLFGIATSAALLPVTPAWAQVRTLPDFTDLVEQVGPSVVNIRTLEKTKASALPLMGGSLLHHYADLLRERRAARRHCVHHRERRRLGPLASIDW